MPKDPQIHYVYVKNYESDIYFLCPLESSYHKLFKLIKTIENCLHIKLNSNKLRTFFKH